MVNLGKLDWWLSLENWIGGYIVENSIGGYLWKFGLGVFIVENWIGGYVACDKSARIGMVADS